MINDKYSFMPGKIRMSALKLLLLHIILYSATTSYSQEMQAVTQSKYAGIHGAFLNPSMPVLSPLYLDINLVSANVFVQNNYIYIFSEEDKIGRIVGRDIQSAVPGQKFYSDSYTPSAKYGQVNVSILGPSAAVMVGKHAFGITTGMRSITSIREMPYTLAKFFYEGLYFPPQYDMTFDYPDKMTFGSLHWGELGFNYSGLIVDNYDNNVSAGLTVKKLMGYSGAYVTMEHLSYRVPNHDTLIVYDADMEAGLSVPLNYTDNSFMSSPITRGSGTGVDIGITWERKAPNGSNNDHFDKLCSQDYTPYLFRAGVSVTDIGSIKFTDNSMKLRVTDGSLFWPGISGTQFTNVNDMAGELSNRFFGNPQSLRVDDQFTITLPAMVNVHADVNLTAIIAGRTSTSLSYNLHKSKGSLFSARGEWFISGLVMLPIISRNSTVVRQSLISAGARYETRYMQVGINTSLSGFDTFMLGANVRIGYFFVGTDNLVSFLKLNDYTGTNLYAGLKFNLIKGRCRDNGSKCPDIF
jgi:hypothetical protein